MLALCLLTAAVAEQVIQARSSEKGGLRHSDTLPQVGLGEGKTNQAGPGRLNPAPPTPPLPFCAKPIPVLLPAVCFRCYVGYTNLQAVKEPGFYFLCVSISTVSSYIGHWIFEWVSFLAWLVYRAALHLKSFRFRCTHLNWKPIFENKNSRFTYTWAFFCLACFGNDSVFWKQVTCHCEWLLSLLFCRKYSSAANTWVVLLKSVGNSWPASPQWPWKGWG